MGRSRVMLLLDDADTKLMATGTSRRIRVMGELNKRHQILHSEPVRARRRSPVPACLGPGPPARGGGVRGVAGPDTGQ
jgi:hypothetical protein